ncbi:MAG: tetratricopeptide repeat protein [Deferrisomatales bacterium]|nr:tetratricopeptide repeat protein [Deferrisomatales bacterium]
MRRWHCTGIVAATYCCVGILLYWRVITGGVFVFDDFDYILEEPAILQPLRYVWDFTELRYVSFYSFALNHALGGLDPTGYHAVNVGIHVLNAVLVYLLSGRLLSRAATAQGEARATVSWVALFASALFLVHPIQTQAVAYVAQRMASLATFFILLCAVLYVAARERSEIEERRSWAFYGQYLGSAVVCLLGMKTKEIAFTTPLLILLVEALFFQGSRFGRNRFAWALPHVALMVVIPLSLFANELGLGSGQAKIYDRMRVQRQGDLQTLSPYLYFVNQIRVIVLYLRKLFIPTDLHLQYVFDAAYTWKDPRVLSCGAVLGAVVGGVAVLWRRSIGRVGGRWRYVPVVLFGVGWFFLGLSVESSVIPIKDLVFEHRVYLPSAGFFMAVVALLAWAMPRARLRTAGVALAALAAVGVTATYSVGTYRRNEIWTDEVALWGDVSEKAPRSFAAHHNRGVALFQAGKYHESLESLNAAADLFHQSFRTEAAWRDPSISPENAGIVFGFRSKVLILSGQREEAVKDFNRVLNLARAVRNPGRMIPVMTGIADRFLEEGYPAEAERQYSAVLDLRPMDPAIHFARAVARGEQGDYSGAIDDLDTAIAAAPGAPPSYFNRAYFLKEEGRTEEASRDLQIACGAGFKLACEVQQRGWGVTEGHRAAAISK